MMNDYTPGTESIKLSYVYVDGSIATTEDRKYAFDDWLSNVQKDAVNDFLLGLSAEIESLSEALAGLQVYVGQGNYFVDEAEAAIIGLLNVLKNA